MRKPDFCICENKDADQLRAAQFVSDLVKNPEDRFSQNEAQIIAVRSGREQYYSYNAVKPTKDADGINKMVKTLTRLGKYIVSLIMRNLAFCICKNNGADQLGSNCTTDQRLCFRYIDGTIPLLPKSEISGCQLFFVAVQPGMCQPCSEIPKTGFLATRRIGSFVMKLLKYMSLVVRKPVSGFLTR